jgi:ABC-2 type transport system permease protein
MKHRLQILCAAARMTIQDYLAQPMWPFWLTITSFAFALVAVFMYQGAPPETFALYVVLGSGAMGMWASVLGGCGYSMIWERRWGTIQYTFTTPASQLWIAAGKSLIHAATGLIVLLEVVIVTALFFGVQLTIGSPGAFLLATLLTILAFAVIGLLLNSFFMVTRSASHWQNALSRFLYVFCGAMYPISVLPDWLRPISYVLAPTWSLEATRLSVNAGALSSPAYLTRIGLTLLLMAVYLLLAWYVQRVAERRLRVTAELERI